MHLTAGMILLLIGWGVALLVLWNFYRYSQALRRRAFGMLAGLLTLAAAAGMLHLHQHHTRWQHARGRSVLIFPFLNRTPQGFTLTSEGLAHAGQLVEYLRGHRLNSYYLLPPGAVFELAEFDSLAQPAYLLRLARHAGLQEIGIGVLHPGAAGQEMAFQLYSPPFAEPLLQYTFVVSPAAADSAIRSLSERLWAHWHGKPPAPTASASIVNWTAAQQREYYDLLLLLLRGRRSEVAGRAMTGMRQDTTNTRMLELAADATLQYLREKRAPPTEWRDSLRVLVPRLEQSIARDSLRIAPFLRLAECQLQLKRWNEAEALLRRARALDEHESKVYVNFAHLHQSRLTAEGFANELELLQYALALNPLDMEAAVGTAEYLMLESRPAEAIALLEKYRQFNPNHLPLLMALGRIYINQGRVPEILSLYEHLLKLDPRNADALYNLGIAYYNLKDLDNARRFFERALAIGNHLEARLYLAYLHEQRGDTTQAIRYLRERIRLSTGDDDVFAGEARKHLYQLLLLRGEIPEHLMPEKLDKK